MISNEYLVSDQNSNLIKLRKRAEESNLTPKEEALFITMYARTKTGRKNQTFQLNCFVVTLPFSTSFLHFIATLRSSCSSLRAPLRSSCSSLRAPLRSSCTSLCAPLRASHRFLLF